MKPYFITKFTEYLSHFVENIRSQHTVFYPIEMYIVLSPLYRDTYHEVGVSIQP